MVMSSSCLGHVSPALEAPSPHGTPGHPSPMPLPTLEKSRSFGTLRVQAPRPSLSTTDLRGGFWWQTEIDIIDPKLTLTWPVAKRLKLFGSTYLFSRENKTKFKPFSGSRTANWEQSTSHCLILLKSFGKVYKLYIYIINPGFTHVPSFKKAWFGGSEMEENQTWSKGLFWVKDGIPKSLKNPSTNPHLFRDGMGMASKKKKHPPKITTSLP